MNKDRQFGLRLPLYGHLLFMSSKRAWSAFAILALALGVLGSSIAYACLSGEYDSVHFHSSEPDFGLAPRRGALSWRGEHDDRPFRGNPDEDMGNAERGGLELTEEGDTAKQVELDRKYRLCLRSAEADIRVGHWSRARRTLQQEGETHRWRGNLRDRVQTLRQVEALRQLPPAQAATLRIYLNGLNADEAENRSGAQSAFARVAAVPAAGFLREYAQYQLASLSAEYFDYPRAVDQYRQLLQAYPHTSKREDALIMIARCALLPQTAPGRRVDVGKACLAQLRQDFPHGRFQCATIGLKGRVYFLNQQWMQALPCYFAVDDLPSIEMVCKFLPGPQRGAARVKLMAAYLRRLARAASYHTYENAIVGLDRTYEMLTTAYAAAFSRLLLNQADLAAPYFYYRLYHTDMSHKDLLNLAHLADRIIALHPAAQISAAIQTQLAEVYYQGGQYTRALIWANRALRQGGTERALYVRGATLNHLGRSEAAFADFRGLADRFPHSPLLQATRENLALLYEAQHEFGRALDQYLALNYQLDIAYLLDILMTPDEVAAYVLTRHMPSYQNLLTYSLGIRYLRSGRYHEAVRTFHLMSHKVYVAYEKKRAEECGNHDNANLSCPDPITVAYDLAKLERAISLASSDNARASALYRLASYYSRTTRYCSITSRSGMASVSSAFSSGGIRNLPDLKI